MFVFERLISRDFKTVFYLIKDRKKNIFNFYTQDEDIITRIIMSSEWEETFFDVYTSLLKTNQETLPDSLMEWKVPAQSKCVRLDYQKIIITRNQRAKAGKPTRLRLKP